MSPNGGDKPTGELAAAIDDAFGSFDKFRGQFTSAATTVQGSGWAALGWDSLGQKLLVFQVYDHQTNFPLGIVPLRRLFSANRDQTVREVMRTDFIAASDEMDQEALAKLFSEEHLLAIPVIDKDGKMKGA